MDPFFECLSLFRRRKFEQASEACSRILATSPFDQAAWTLKLRCLTQPLYIDDVENDFDDDGNVADDLLDENFLAQKPQKPGTSLRTAAGVGTSGARPDTGQTYRPRAQTGRPLSGIIRPGTNRGKPGTSMERTLRTARTASTSRPSTSMAGRFVRLGTASMAVNPGGPFVNLSRLNFEKYASQFYLAKPLFEYMFYCENDLRNVRLSMKPPFIKET